MQLVWDSTAGKSPKSNELELPTWLCELWALHLAPQNRPHSAVAVQEGSETDRPVDFPPHQAGDNEQPLAQHRAFQIYPPGRIPEIAVCEILHTRKKNTKYTRFPESVRKVFYYTFTLRDETAPYLVLWDSINRSVFINPFFRSPKYSLKKAIEANPGLKTFLHKTPQGCDHYWVPYETAKAILATFCYDIRLPLTPLFGKTFPSACLHPDDAGFAKFVIDSDDFRKCVEQTEKEEQLELGHEVHEPPAPTNEAITVLLEAARFLELQLEEVSRVEKDTVETLFLLKRNPVVF